MQVEIKDLKSHAIKLMLGRYIADADNYLQILQTLTTKQTHYFKEFVLFSLIYPLQNNSQHNEEFNYKLIECLIFVIEKNCIDKWTIFLDLYKIFINELCDQETQSLIKHNISEENFLILFQFLDSLIKYSDENIIYNFFSEEFLPLLANIVYLINNLLLVSSNFCLKDKLISILGTMINFAEKDKFYPMIKSRFTAFLPQTCSVLYINIKSGVNNKHDIENILICLASLMSLVISENYHKSNNKIKFSVGHTTQQQNEIACRLIAIKKNKGEHNKGPNQMKIKDIKWLNDTLAKFNLIFHSLYGLVEQSTKSRRGLWTAVSIILDINYKSLSQLTQSITSTAHSTKYINNDPIHSNEIIILTNQAKNFLDILTDIYIYLSPEFASNLKKKFGIEIILEKFHTHRFALLKIVSSACAFKTFTHQEVIKIRRHLQIIAQCLSALGTQMNEDDIYYGCVVKLLNVLVHLLSLIFCTEFINISSTSSNEYKYITTALKTLTFDMHHDQPLTASNSKCIGEGESNAILNCVKRIAISIGKNCTRKELIDYFTTLFDFIDKRRKDCHTINNDSTNEIEKDLRVNDPNPILFIINESIKGFALEANLNKELCLHLIKQVLPIYTAIEEWIFTASLIPTNSSISLNKISNIVNSEKKNNLGRIKLPTTTRFNTLTVGQSYQPDLLLKSRKSYLELEPPIKSEITREGYRTLPHQLKPFVITSEHDTSPTNGDNSTQSHPYLTLYLYLDGLNATMDLIKIYEKCYCNEFTGNYNTKNVTTVRNNITAQRISFSFAKDISLKIYIIKTTLYPLLLTRSLFSDCAIQPLKHVQNFFPECNKEWFYERASFALEQIQTCFGYKSTAHLILANSGFIATQISHDLKYYGDPNFPLHIKADQGCATTACIFNYRFTFAPYIFNALITFYTNKLEIACNNSYKNDQDLSWIKDCLFINQKEDKLTTLIRDSIILKVFSQLKHQYLIQNSKILLPLLSIFRAYTKYTKTLTQYYNDHIQNFTSQNRTSLISSKEKDDDYIPLYVGIVKESLDILPKFLYFDNDCHLMVRNLIYDCIENGLVSLASYTNIMLPVIHVVWQPLIDTLNIPILLHMEDIKTGFGNINSTQSIVAKYNNLKIKTTLHQTNAHRVLELVLKAILSSSNREARDFVRKRTWDDLVKPILTSYFGYTQPDTLNSFESTITNVLKDLSTSTQMIKQPQLIDCQMHQKICKTLSAIAISLVPQSIIDI